MEHHAYFVEGDPTLLEAVANGVRARERIESHDPNFVERVYEKFGIDEAKEVQELALFKAVGEKSFFIIAISSITTEAQQALLKLFEEPREGLVFILVVPHGVFIPTLRSRLLPYPYEVKKPAQATLEAKKFLSAPYKVRSTYIAGLLKDEDFVKDRVRSFLQELEVVLYAALTKSKGKKEYREALEDIAKVRSYVGDRSPSLKMLFEHLALALPQL